MVAVTYFLTPNWFLDTYAATGGHTANFASPFIDHSSRTLVGNSAWRAETQRVALTINRAF
jgi:hypothetical protein